MLEPKEIRDVYTDFMNEWKDTRDEGATDMRYVAGDPWDPKDRREREDAGRPCISLDEINQYLNQYNNSLRQNKRGIQVIPKGMGANDKNAATRENIIRGIEYESTAQQCYIAAAESAAQRGYGFGLIRTEYKDQESFDQKIVIHRVSDPNTILITPYYERADASDINEAFVLRRIARKEFKEKFPDADQTNFTNEDMRLAPEWIGDKWLQIAEFWKIYYKRRKLLLMDTPEGEVMIWKDTLDQFGKKEKDRVKRERWVDTPEVKQVLTNGLEILDENKWAGSRIPIISCFGKELWIDEGGDQRRKYLSMVRLARDPQMLYAYMCSLECEEAAQTPKTPFIGYTPQFEDDRESWETINTQPKAYVKVGVTNDAGGNVLPLPTRIPFQPNFQQYEIAKDSTRRAIQAAMGISPLPTAAQRNTEKSGVALERIETSESLGSFHFADNFEMFLANMGWQVNELIKPIYDTDREVVGISPDEQYEVINTVGDTSHPPGEDGKYDTQSLPADVLHTGEGNFDVTISTAPYHQSQREAQSDFVDQLISQMPNLPPPNTPQAKILALGIRMRTDLGPIGKQIADVLDPPDPNNLPPEAQSIVQGLQAQVQQLTTENAALHEDRAGRVLEQQTKLEVAQLKHQSEGAIAQLQQDVKVLIAEITAKSQRDDQETQMYRTFWMENHKAAHETGMQAVDQQHQMAIADKQAQAAQDTQSAQQAHEVGMSAMSAAQNPQQNTP